MDPLAIDPTRVRGLRRYRWWIPAGAVVVTAVLAAVTLTRGSSAPRSPLPLRPAGEVALPGDSSRFDYASLDPGRGLLFIAHLGASDIIEVDLHTHQVVRTIPNVTDVHGVLVVPALHRVYATATGDNQVLSLDEDTGTVLTGHRPGPTQTEWPTTRAAARSGRPTRPAAPRR